MELAVPISSGGAELCGGALADCQEDGGLGSSAGGGEINLSRARASRHRADALDHGAAKAVGDACGSGDRGIRIANTAGASMLRTSAGCGRKRASAEIAIRAAHDMRVAVREILQHVPGPPPALDRFDRQTRMAQPCTLLKGNCWPRHRLPRLPAKLETYR